MNAAPLLGQAVWVSTWLTPLWIISVGALIGLAILVVLLATCWLLSRLPGIGSLGDQRWLCLGLAAIAAVPLAAGFRLGRPDTPDDLAMHAKVGYVDDLVYSAELQYANEFLRDWRSAFEVTTAMGQLEVVKAGGSIGALHDFMAFGQPGLVRLFPELVAQRTYWTVWHENMRAARRVAAVASFLDDIVREARAAFLPARPR